MTPKHGAGPGVRTLAGELKSLSSCVCELGRERRAACDARLTWYPNVMWPPAYRAHLPFKTQDADWLQENKNIY